MQKLLLKFSFLRFSALAACFVACALPSLAQDKAPATPAVKGFVKETGFNYGPWRSSILGGGGYLQNVVPAPSNPKRFYAYVDVGGLYRSDDGGRRWRMLHGNLPPGLESTEVRGLVVDPRDDRKIIIAAGSQWAAKGGISVSDDAGQTWKKTLTARYLGNGNARSAGFILARSPQNPDVVMTASVDDGVWKSEDNGQTWKESGGKNLYPTDLRFDRTSAQRLWLCAGGGKTGKTQYVPGFYRSDDGGATWNKRADVSPSEIVQDPRNAATIYGIFGGNLIRRSADAGAVWEDWSQGLKLDTSKKPGSISPTGYNALAAGPDFVLTGSTSDSTFYRLPAGGAHWETVERNAPEVGDWFHKGSWYFGGAMGSIIVDPNDSEHWFITDFFAIYQTFDAGKNWRLTIDGIEVTVSHALLQDPSDPAVVHLGQADVGPATSLDGGRRLRQNRVPDDKGAPSGGKNMKAVDLSPKSPNRLYGVGDRSYFNGWVANQVYISVDRGATWRRSPMVGLPDMGKNACTTIVADLNDPYTVYLTVSGPIKDGGGGGVYKSTDGGARWAWMSQGMPVKAWANYFFPYDIWAHGRQLAASGDRSLIAISQQQNLVYRFDPKAGQWSPARFPRGGGKLWSVVADRLKPGRFFIGVRSDGLYRTDDSGLTWKKVYDKSVSYVATDGAIAGRVAGATLDGVVLSTDGGETWKTLDKSLPYRFDNIPAFVGERLMVGSGGSGVFWMPLSAAGEKEVSAKPFAPALPSLKGALPELVNLDGDAEGPAPAGWKLETTTGAARLLRDTKTRDKKGAASLQIATEMAARGTLYQEWKPMLHTFNVGGVARGKGDFTRFDVVIRSFDEGNKELAPVVLGSFKPNEQWWDGFSQRVTLPLGAARCRLALDFEGKGQIWLDSVQMTLPDPLFLQ